MRKLGCKVIEQCYKLVIFNMHNHVKTNNLL